MVCCPLPRLPMVHQNSLRFYSDVAYERYGGLVLGDQEGARLARAGIPSPAFWLASTQAGWAAAV